ncbi:MAG TPA: ABC transporter permease [Terriglobales bacterium]|nr:ABC transporter permease [Terriglobales bacterium]
MNGILQDVRYAVRQLGNNRGFTIVAVLTLALGIGANTAIFSVVNGVLLNPLPFPNANRIVSMFQDVPNFTQASISYPNFLDWQRENHSFEAIAAYRWADGTITGVGEGEHVQAKRISANFFPILGVTPILGRNFTTDEDRRGANPVVMISEGLWRRKFGSAPNVIGKRVIVGGEGRTIVGVVPASFRLIIQNFKTSDIYEPIGEERDQAFYNRDSFWGTDAIGLLKPGVKIEQAREDMKRVNAGLAATYPDIDAHLKSTILSLKDEIVKQVRPVLWVLLGAVGFVLLIACVNVANLLLARSTGRQREFSIRVALGAGQRRILRQLLTESVLLALLGGVLGLVVAKWGTAAAIAAAPAGSYAPTIPRAEEIGLDWRVLCCAFVVSLITGIAFGLVPGLRASRKNVSGTLKDTGRSISTARSRVQALFVAGEMAMALVLLVGAGLMVRTLAHLWALDPGFDPHNVINFDIYPPPSLASQSPEAIRAAFREVDSRIHSVPGVESVSLSWDAQPMEGDTEKSFLVEGQQSPARQADLPSTLDYVVEPEYLKAMQIPLLRGRFITEADNENSARVAVIDSSFAHQYFSGQDPVGKHLRILDFDSDPTKETWIQLTIVGVVAHVSQFGLSDDPIRPLHAQLYLSVMQRPDTFIRGAVQGGTGFVRFQPPLTPESTFQNIRKQLTSGNDPMVLGENYSEEEVVARSIGNQRFALVLFGAFAGLALLLASIGIYGVLSYLTGQRTREIGVRMALGAQRFDVLRMVLTDGTKMALAGVAIGVVAALGLTQLMASMLFAITPTDPVTFSAVAVVLSLVALFACYLPARRAAKVDPMVALRYE